MAFTPQAPAGPPTPAANSLAAVSDFIAYWTDRGDTEAAGADAALIQASLISATQVLGDFCKYPFSGELAFWNQLPPWPRVGACIAFGPAIPEEVVPQGVIDAACELAGRAVKGIVLQPDYARGGAVKRKTVDVLTTEWFDGAPPGTLFSAVEAYLGRFLRPGGISNPLLNSPQPYAVPGADSCAEFFHFGMTNDMPGRGGGRQ